MTLVMGKVGSEVSSTWIACVQPIGEKEPEERRTLGWLIVDTGVIALELAKDCEAVPWLTNCEGVP
jgi:hypothetical protein